MKVYQPYFLFYLLFFFGSNFATAQENTLDQYIQEAFQQNLDIESANLRRTQQVSKIGQAQKM